MRIEIPSFANGAPIPGEYAFAIPDANAHVALSSNRNPQVSWTDLPDGTRSLALICHDPDVPTVPDDVNVEGRTVPADLPRTDFTHWVLVDIDPGLGEIPSGASIADPILFLASSMARSMTGQTVDVNGGEYI